MTAALALALLASTAAPPTAPLTESDAVGLALQNRTQVKFRDRFVDEAQGSGPTVVR
jgi:hypothetical protein